MNKFFAANLSFTLLCLAALLASCEKGSTGSGSGSGSETPPEGGSAQLVLSDPSDKTLSAEGHTFSITFRTNQDWTASSSEEWWCYVSPASGKASDSAISINCEVDENSSQSERSSVITIQAGSLKKSSGPGLLYPENPVGERDRPGADVAGRRADVPDV